MKTTATIAAALALLAIGCGNSKSSAAAPADASADARGPTADATSPDAGAADASADGAGMPDGGEGDAEMEAGGPGTFPCGPLSCNESTEFCFEEGGGAPIDGGNTTYACKPIPPVCQVNPTCGCIEEADAGTEGCPCNVENGGFLVGCLHP